MKKSCFGILFFLLVTAMSVSVSALTITVTSASPSLPIGLKQQFKATSTIGTTAKDLTSMVTWSSSNKSVAVMDETTPGLVIGKAEGTITITAKFGSDSGTAKLTVTPLVTLSKIEIEPKDSSLYVGEVSKQFKATGTYSDEKERDVTKEVIWQSSNTAVATIDPEKGLVYPKSVGETTISAILSGTTGKTSLSVVAKKKFGTAEGSAKPSTLLSIKVVPETASVNLSATKFFLMAVGYFGNPASPTTLDITKDVTWKSSNEAVATVYSSGLVETKAVGTTTISAQHPEAKSVSPGKATLNVTSPPPAPKIIGVKLGEPKPSDCKGCSGPGGEENAFMCPEDYVVTGYEMGVSDFELLGGSPPIPPFWSGTDPVYTKIVGGLGITCSELSLEGVSKEIFGERRAKAKDKLTWAGTTGTAVVKLKEIYGDRRDNCFNGAKDVTAVAVGVSGRSGSRLDAFGLLCGSYTKAGMWPIFTSYSMSGKKKTSVSPGEGGSPFDEKCPEGFALVGIGIKSGDEVDGITKIYCAKVEPVWDREPKPMSREIRLPTDTGDAQPASPARDLRMIPPVEPAPQPVPQEVSPNQYLPQDVQPVPPTSTPRRVPEEE